ncbi:MAG: hypothetical protein ACLVJ6_04900 [Merdibacter sp.]
MNPPAQPANPNLARAQQRHRRQREDPHDQVDKYDYIDVSEGTAQQLGISEGKLNAAIQYAKREGALHKISYRQMTTGKPTRYYVLPVRHDLGAGAEQSGQDPSDERRLR